MAEDWTSEGMEGRRPACFPFFLGTCENGEACNYSHAPIFKAGLSNIPGTASKEQLQDQLDDFNPVHIAFTGNPMHLNFGKGQGIVGFGSEDDLVKATVATNKPKYIGVQVLVIDHKCKNCQVEMRFSAGGTAYYKSNMVTGTKKDPKLIARPASGPFECGQCGEGSKKIASSTQPRSLKQGEAVW